MESQSSNDHLLHRLSIVIRNASPKENAKATALELLRRASSLDESIHTLRLDYTYEIMATDQKKIDSRKMLGKMVLELLETMRDEFVRAGIKEWGRYESL
jgi:hypothetical protein